MNSRSAIISLETAHSEAHPWIEPRPLACPTPPSLDLEECIPPGLAPLRHFCTAVAESLQVPPDAVPPLALALASIGTNRALEIQLTPQWRETAALWFAVLAESGERKSGLLSQLAAPLYAWQERETASLRDALASYAERRESTVARLAVVRGKFSRATGPDRQALENEALDLAVALEKIPPLASPSLITSDTTPEALRDLLARNGEKAGWVSAEADVGQIMGNRYAKAGGANIDLLLKAYTGDPVTVHRIGRDVTLSRPALALALFVQPAAVADVLRDPYARDRGLVPRLCLIAPTSRMGRRSLHPAEVPPDLLRWWADTLRRLLDLKWPGRVIITAEGPTRCEAAPHIMRPSPDAMAIFDVLRADIEKRIGEGGDLRPICGFASKLPGVILRLALTFEAMQNPSAEIVSADTMGAAVAWAPFLLAHYRAVLGDAGESSERRHARRLVAAIVRQGLREVTERECFNLIDGLEVPSMAEFQPILSELIETNYLRLLSGEGAKPKTPGRPASPRYEVNPAVFTSP